GRSCRRRLPACSRHPWASPACMPMIWSSSKPGCCSTTLSIVGVAMPLMRLTTGPPISRGLEMNEALPKSILVGSTGPIPYPSLREATLTWVRVALLSFGGPAGQIAVMHRILVEEKRWICEQRFLHALNYCMLLPGPEAQQLATYVGWLMHRTPGGLVAGGLFILPGIICVMVLSYVYALLGRVPVVTALFFGLKAAVLAIVIEAVVRIGKRALKSRSLVALAAAAF